jgi:GcrA cell cycle regulator
MWTKEIIAKLVKLAAQGLSYTEIGKALGITKNAAIGKARRLRISKPPAEAVIKQRKPTPKPKEKPAPKQPTPPEKGTMLAGMKFVNMMDLKDDHCRYPIDKDGETVFCGLPKFKKSFCQEHGAKCYMPPRPLPPHSGRRT